MISFLQRPVGSATAAAVAVAVLVVTNLADNRWAPSLWFVTCVLTVLVLCGVLWWAGATWTDVGLSRATLGRGALWALALIGIVAVCFLIAAFLPLTRGLFADQRTAGLTGGEVVFRMFVKVPLGTVLLEEFAFRGVLYGLVRRGYGTVWATAVSSLLFGLWHILPSAHLATVKPALASVFGHSTAGAVLADAAAVVFTALAGALLCELRRRSSSLLAPIGLHWATNAFGYLAAFLTSGV